MAVLLDCFTEAQGNPTKLGQRLPLIQLHKYIITALRFGMTYKTDSTAREIKTHLLSMVTVAAALWYALEGRCA